MVFPSNVNKIKVVCNVKTSIDEKEQEYEEDVQENTDLGANSWGKCYVACHRNDFSIDKLKDELEFDIKVTIKELYDINNDSIPFEKWEVHNVLP